METIIRSRHGYREKKINVADHPSSNLWKAVPRAPQGNDFWKVVVAVVLVVFAAVLLLRTEVIGAVRSAQAPAPAESGE